MTQMRRGAEKVMAMVMETACRLRMDFMLGTSLYMCMCIMYCIKYSVSDSQADHPIRVASVAFWMLGCACRLSVI
jgi:hypothetical protein